MNESRLKRIEMLEEYIREDASDYFSRYALALEYMQLQKNEEAIAMLEKILEEKTSFLAAYYQLGKANESVKENSKAEIIYRKGMEIAREQKEYKTENELKAALLSLTDEDDF